MISVRYAQNPGSLIPMIPERTPMDLQIQDAHGSADSGCPWICRFRTPICRFRTPMDLQIQIKTVHTVIVHESCVTQLSIDYEQSCLIMPNFLPSPLPKI